MQTTFEEILVAVEGPLCVVTINRPKVLNALNGRVIDELTAALSGLQNSLEVRAVVLTGAGERAFVAGADIAAMAQLSPAEAEAFAARGHRVGELIAQLPQPVIAAVNGFALGGGLELALACDIIYASKTAKLGQPEVKIGVMPGFGGTQRLIRRVGLGQASRLILGADPITAEEAHAMGLVDVLCEPANLLADATTLAKNIAARAPLAIAASKKALHASFELPLSEANRLECRLFGQLFATADQREGMAAFLAKRPSQFTGT
jgi:enoyl-CoA hydratase